MKPGELKHELLLRCMPEDARSILADNPSDSLFSALYGDEIAARFYNYACGVIKLNLSNIGAAKNLNFQPLKSLQTHALIKFFNLSYDMQHPEVQKFLTDINWQPRPDRVSGNVKQREQDRLEAALNLTANLLELLADQNNLFTEAKIKAVYRCWFAFEEKQKASVISMQRQLTL